MVFINGFSYLSTNSRAFCPDTSLLFVLCNVIKPEGAAVIEKCTHTQTSSKWRQNSDEKLQVNTGSYHDGLLSKIINAHTGMP